MTNTKINFDAARYCRNNAGRMGKWMDGSDIAGMIADEVERLRAELAALKNAARPVAKWWKNDGPFLRIHTASQLDALAALVGEE